jgi:L-threonylcarbamoyladenylate synthase
VNPSTATLTNIRVAAQALLDGKLVVIPTETVYGLAADATNRAAILSIFEAKGRPADNPLIVHVGEPSWVDDLATDVPKYARSLIREFWPGPITLVLQKLPHVLDEVTGGLETVAIRMPQHGVALEVIRAAGIPVAAPSANRFMSLSPTRANHIDPLIAGRAAMVLDGGPSNVGLESTVVDCTGDKPRILRPGHVGKKEIEETVGIEVLLGPTEARRSPGMYARHYAPQTPVCLVPKLEPDQAGLVLSELTNPAQVLMPTDPVAYGALLYETLYDLDQVGLEMIFVEEPPQSPAWEAVWDRLRKASI